MARTARAKRAAKVARAAPKGSAKQKAAHAVIRAEKEAQKVAKTGGLKALRGKREEQMDIRAERFKTGGDQTLEDTIAAANQARAYADAMRRITEREMGERTPYTGGGIELTGDPGVDQRVLRQPLKAFERERFMAGPTESQLRNIDWMLREGEGDTVQDIRKDWRENVWDDTFNEATGRWERGDRTSALATQAGLLDQPLPNIFKPEVPYNINLDQSNLNQLNRKQGTSAFQHPYAADPYKVPHMETGGLWEGLGAEYQPGTVEGLGLLAGKAHAPYTPLRQGLLNARPDFMGTPSKFTPMNFKGGIEGSTDTANTSNSAMQSHYNTMAAHYTNLGGADNQALATHFTNLSLGLNK